MNLLALQASMMAVSTATDPFFANVKALAHYDGSFSDQVSGTWTNGGNVIIATTATKFGSGCAQFNGGTTSYLQSPNSSDFTVGTGQYTRETWFRGTGTPANNYIFDTGSGNEIVLLFNASGKLAYFDPVLTTSGALFNSGPANTVICDGNWHHLAISKDASGVVRAFADGVMWGALTSTYNQTAAATSLWLGRYGGGGSNMIGYLDDHRFTKGVCRYATNFTPPAAPFPNS